MKNETFYNEFERLEDNFQELHDYIKTMGYALQEIVDSGKDADCLVLLAGLINKKSSEFFEQLEDFSVEIYKNYL